jgi:hypothetical protein
MYTSSMLKRIIYIVIYVKIVVPSVETIDPHYFL